MNQKKVVVLFSGGLDSVACLLYAVEKYGIKRVTALFINWGAQSFGIENKFAHQTAKKIGVKFIEFNQYSGSRGKGFISTPDFRQVPVTMLTRNETFLKYVAHHFGELIIIGQNHTDILDWYQKGRIDCHPRFIKRVNKWYKMNQVNARVVAPLRHISKLDVVSKFKDLFRKYDLSPIRDTFSCWTARSANPSIAPECGICEPCVHKYAAIRNARYTHKAVVRRFGITPLHARKNIVQNERGAKNLPQNVRECHPELQRFTVLMRKDLTTFSDMSTRKIVKELNGVKNEKNTQNIGGKTWEFHPEAYFPSQRRAIHDAPPRSVSGFVHKENGKQFSCVLVREGSRLSITRKWFIWKGEPYSRGAVHPTPVQTRSGMFLPLICYDVIVFSQAKHLPPSWTDIDFLIVISDWRDSFNKLLTSVKKLSQRLRCNYVICDKSNGLFSSAKRG